MPPRPNNVRISSCGNKGASSSTVGGLKVRVPSASLCSSVSLASSSPAAQRGQMPVKESPRIWVPHFGHFEVAVSFITPQIRTGSRLLPSVCAGSTVCQSLHYMTDFLVHFFGAGDCISNDLSKCFSKSFATRSEERRVGKECRSCVSP